MHQWGHKHTLFVLHRPVAAKAAKDGEPTVGSQLSSAAAPQPGDIMEDMDWEVEHSFVDESYLQVGTLHRTP